LVGTFLTSIGTPLTSISEAADFDREAADCDREAGTPSPFFGVAFRAAAVRNESSDAVLSSAPQFSPSRTPR
jgi:hypothetical protein